MLFCCLLIFFSKSTFLKTISGIPSEFTDLARLLSRLVWVQSVCKSYEQRTRVGNELNGQLSLDDNLPNSVFRG